MTIRNQFQIDVYDCNIYVIISDNLLQSINSQLRHYGDDPIRCCPSGYMYRHGDSTDKYYIFLLMDDLTVDIINHEKSHATEQILIDRNIKSRGEVYAFLDGCISRKMDKIFKKHNLQIKNRRS